MSAVRRALITGITGQDGSFLAEFLLERDYEVYGLVRRTSTESQERLGPVGERIMLLSGDLLDEASLVRALEVAEPREVYNLASQSSVQTSLAQPTLTGEVTALGVTRMLEAVRQVDPTIRFFQASSSEMFGSADEVPQRETTPFHPRSPYGAAKLYGHEMTRTYREAFGLYSVSGILYNHESERRSLRFVTRKITDGAARIKLGLAHELRLGNLAVMRDWGFSGDYVRAMWLMLQPDTPDDYVIATGEAHSVEQFCELAFEALDLDWRQYVVSDPVLFRPTEVDLLVGSAAKARRQLGWVPRVSLRKLVQRMVEADMARLMLDPSLPAAA